MFKPNSNFDDHGLRLFVIICLTNPGSCRRRYDEALAGGYHCERSEIRKGFGGGLGPGWLGQLALFAIKFHDCYLEPIFGITSSPGEESKSKL